MSLTQVRRCPNRTVPPRIFTYWPNTLMCAMSSIRCDQTIRVVLSTGASLDSSSQYARLTCRFDALVSRHKWSVLMFQMFQMFQSRPGR